jgi:proteasome lid subunit RPN8/RPN11
MTKPTAQPLTYLELQREHVLAIVQQIQSHPGQEVCGFVIGDGATAKRLVPITNRGSMPDHHFRMDYDELLKLLKSIDRTGEQILATYHTHPSGDLDPSQDDIDSLGMHWPNVLHVIAALKNQELRLKGWHINEQDIITVPITVDTTPSNSAIRERLSRPQKVAIILATILSVAFVVMVAISLLPPPPELIVPLR